MSDFLIGISQEGKIPVITVIDYICDQIFP